MLLSSTLLACLCLFAQRLSAFQTIAVSVEVPADASEALLDSFVSFSIEFAFFPDFAGNSSLPNTFSYNLLSNIGQLQGSNPIIRVGGNTQDYALYNPNLTVATLGIYDFSRSADYPTNLTIGPSYFDSYSTWPNTQFIHGFDLGKNGSVGLNSLLATVPLACKALQNGKLAYWELGNEPDLYKTSSQGPVRPENWTEQDYVDEWLGKTRQMRDVMGRTCPDLVANGTYEFVAPSFGGTHNSLDPIITWQDGLDNDADIALISSHNYIGGATQPGVTLQGTLMNHSSNIASIAPQLNESKLLSQYGLPFILGETNSLYNEGAPGLSNSFGAALWGVDFNLYCASVGIRRVHMHQGLNYRYAAWQPISTVNATIGTKPPYYGSIAVAAMLGDLTTNDVVITNIPMQEETESSYAAYVNGQPARIAVINMIEYNYTGSADATTRPTVTYNVSVPNTLAGTSVSVQRLMANGSDAISGITWDGYSYNWELEQGLPVLLGNVTRNETLVVGQNGTLKVVLPYSSMAILNLAS